MQNKFVAALVLGLCLLLPALSSADEKLEIANYSEQVKSIRIRANELNANIKSNEHFEKMRAKEKVSALTTDERRMLREAWAQLMFFHVQLNLIIENLETKIDISEDRFLNDEYFTIMYGAYLSQYRSGLEFIRSMRRIPTTDKVLNEAYPELAIEINSFAQIKYNYLHIQKFTEYSSYKIQSMSKRVENSILSEGIDEDDKYVGNFNRYKGTLYTIKNAGKITANLIYKGYFPLQKNISEWMGDERVARGEEFLINQEQIKLVHKQLKAGDVLIERREWYLSNIGLPGFWPHAALFIGRPAERAHLEQDKEVQEWVKSQGISSGSFEELLAENYPDVYKESLGQDDHHYDYRVLEAMSEGVVFTSLEHSANADSLAVIRPKLSNVDIAKGLHSSLRYQGRPYDFDFDFRTDSTVVCSELVYYAYQPTSEKKGINFPVTTTLGRPVVTPNNIIKDLAETYGTDKQQFDFVLFLDGNDKKREAVFSDMEALKTTWNRPKWFIFTQNLKK